MLFNCRQLQSVCDEFRFVVGGALWLTLRMIFYRASADSIAIHSAIVI